ncbi:MAG: glycoside hydrolase family 3 protein [Gammaproteobacteria bacterium]|nr:glycoside hydrolase family 3 protein [Gammaproteobacteria bacterium]
MEHQTIKQWPVVASEFRHPLHLNAAIEQQVESRLATLSLESKVAQMIQAELASVHPADIQAHGLGAILNGGGVFPNGNKWSTLEDWAGLAEAFQCAARDSEAGVPILWGTDAVHGHNNLLGATLFPHNIGLGAANDETLMQRLGEETALDVAASGLNWTFAPTLAVPMDYRWGRTYEGYSEDPHLVGKLGSAFLRGLQGQPGTADFLDDAHVLGTSKHFVGEGETEFGIDQGNVVCNERDLREIHAPGHVAALGAGAQIVMAAFNSWHGAKVHGSKYLLTHVLKGHMGFDGFVVSDWDGFAQVHEDFDKAIATSVNAGIDMLMVSADWQRVLKTLVRAVHDESIPHDRLNDAVRRILRVKARMNLLSEGKHNSNERAASHVRLTRSSATKVAREAVRKSLVLMKNDNAVLPLKPRQRVLIVGSHATDVARQCGGWSLTWQGSGNTNDDFPHAESIGDGIRNIVEAAGGEVEITESVDTSSADIGIVVFGEEPYAEGEGDLNHLSFSRDNPLPLTAMHALREKGIPVIALFLTGRPRWINPELNAADAFVTCWLPGTQGGAVAEVLFCNEQGIPSHDFTGKLPFSWPLSSDEFGGASKSMHPERYLPVGFGLSYRDSVQTQKFPEVDTSCGRSLRGPSYQGSYNYPKP